MNGAIIAMNAAVMASNSAGTSSPHDFLILGAMFFAALLLWIFLYK